MRPTRVLPVYLLMLIITSGVDSTVMNRNPAATKTAHCTDRREKLLLLFYSADTITNFCDCARISAATGELGSS